MKSDLRFGVVGLGNIGTRHCGHIDNLGVLSAVCDTDDAKRSPFSNQSVASYATIDEMLVGQQSEMDVVSICTPNNLHCEHTIRALDQGYHVLCEKPMALSSADCGEMIKAAERNNRRLFVVKQNRYNPPVMSVKERLEDGTLGKLYSVHLNCFWNRDERYYNSPWKGTAKQDGGALFTQFSHFIDLLYWLVGDVAEAQSFMENYAHGDMIEFEDTGVASLRFTNGVIGSISFTTASYGQNMEGSLTLFCEKGSIKIGGQYLNELEYQNLESPDIENVDVVDKANDYGTYKGSMSNHDRVYENLIGVLRRGEAISTSGFEGLKTVEIIEKIYASRA